MNLWISMDNDGQGRVEFWTKKPKLIDGIFEPGNEDFLYGYLYVGKDCKKLLGVSPKAGQCIKVKLTAEIVK